MGTKKVITLALAILAATSASYPSADVAGNANLGITVGSLSASARGESSGPGKARIGSPPSAASQSLPNVVLQTQDNKRVHLYDDLVSGKIVLINFMYTACGDSCPLTTANLSRVQDMLGEHLGRDTVMLSITLDPQHDTPKALKAYAQAFATKAGWYFLTGRRADIELLRHKLGLYDPDPIVDADKDQHSGVVVLGNAVAGRWSAIYSLAPPRRIVEALQRVTADPRMWVPDDYSAQE